MLRVLKLGEPVLNYNLTTMACKNSEGMTELIRHAVNIAVENRVNFIIGVVVPRNSIAVNLSQFRHKDENALFQEIAQTGKITEPWRKETLH